MKIINAFWEERNLGISAREIVCSGEDSREELAEALRETPVAYTVLKLPPGTMALMLLATEVGFTFVETQVEVLRTLQNFEDGPYRAGPLAQVGHAPMDAVDVRELQAALKGGLFATDRVALDPHFSLSQANARYAGWITDAVSSGAELFKLLWQGESIGFFAWQQTDTGVGSAFLSGLYPHARGRRLGGAIVLQPLVEARNRDLRLHTTHVSLNNPPILNLHLKFDSRVGAIYYVYVRHQPPLPRP